MRAMADITCPRHRLLSRFADESGRPLCAECFREAVAVAEAKDLEDRIAHLRRPVDQHSAAWLLARLGWGE